MLLVIILIILIFVLLKKSPLNRIREMPNLMDEQGSGIVTKGSYNIPYVRIRTELHDMLGL